MAGIQAIQYQEIVAWMLCRQIQLDPLEVDIILRLDDIYRMEVSERSQQEARKREEKSRSSSAKARGNW